MNLSDRQIRAVDDPIKHVVVLMLENRSFDQMLGALTKVPHLRNLDGVDYENPFSNTLEGEPAYYQAATSTLSIKPDPKHELWHVLRQINRLAEYRPPRESSYWRWGWEWAGVGSRLGWAWLVELIRRGVRKLRRPSMRAAPDVREYADATKFVEDYARSHQGTTRQQRQEIMAYYPLDFLPALHSLGREFAVCDRWHSSVPGPTWANRFFVHTGTALGRVWMPEKPDDVLNKRLRPYTQDTLYKRLDAKSKSWRIYFGDIPQTFVLPNQLLPQNVANYVAMENFKTDTKDEASFPDYCFIEPTYFLQNSNDDHPPHNTMLAQCLIADVYNAIRSNKQLWESTLLVILYDEHGGFFDHVEPPEAIAPDTHSDDYSFTRYGLRVPALLVSPWVRKGVFDRLLDHASLLKYLADKWQLGLFNKRVDNASSFADAFDFHSSPRSDVLPLIADSPAMAEARLIPPVPEKPSGLQLALIVLVAWLANLNGTNTQLEIPADSPEQVSKTMETVRRLLSK